MNDTLRFRVIAGGQVLADTIVQADAPDETVEAQSLADRAVAEAALAGGHDVIVEVRTLDGAHYLEPLHIPASDWTDRETPT